MIQDAKDMLARLVAFPTVSHRSNLDLVHFIGAYLSEHHIPYYLVRDEQEEKASLHCRIGPAVDGGVILSGHTDVVPVEGQPWDTDPFELTEKDGKLYARGAADMKGFLACCLSLVPVMAKAELKRPVYFAFSYDEETGCRAAPALIEHIKASYGESPRYAVIGEPSGMQPVLGQKGIGIFRTTVTGSQGHSSRIREEVSAIHVAARLIAWLEDKMQALFSSGSLDERFSPGCSTLHAGLVGGGLAANVIAGSCFFEWDMRVIPGDDPEAIFGSFLAYCREMETELRQRFTGARIDTRLVHPVVPPLDTPADSDAARLISRLTGRPDYTAVAYASEAGQFARSGYGAVICGPGFIAQAHRANEYISVEQLEKGMAFVGKVLDWCREKP